MGTVFAHQIHDHFKSLRFQISLVLLLLFFGANAAVYTWKLERLERETAGIDAVDEQHYEKVQTLGQAVNQTYRVVARPVGTEFMAEGGFNWFADAASIPVATDRNGIDLSNVRVTNNWMRKFEVVDWVLITRLVLSFLCIVLAYDAVCGEREDGTLGLALANPLSRGRFLVGKFLASLLVLLVVMLAGSLLSLLVLAANEGLELSARLWRGYALFLLAAALYSALFLLLSMAVSARVRSTSSALVILLLLWSGLIVLLPQASYLIGVSAVEVEDFRSERDQMRGEAMAALAREGISPRGREAGKVDDYAVEQRYAARLRELEKAQERALRKAEQQLMRRYGVARAVNLLSPGFAFQYTVEAFLGTGIARRQSFVRQAWEYRHTLREFLRARDAADPASPHILFLPGYMSDQPLKAGLIPRFGEKPLPLGRSLAAGVVPILILVLEAGAAFFAALWAINRTEIAA